jgi:hypothetical protein
MADLPRFDVLGGSGANFRNVRTVTPSGNRAEAELFNSVSQDFQVHSARFQRAQDAANKAELARRDIDLDLKAQEIRERNRLNPGGFNEDMENYINATAENVPEEVRGAYMLRARQKTAATFINERQKFVAHQLDLGKRDAEAFIEVQENRLLSYGVPSNEVELQLMQDDQSIYERFLDSEIAAGNLTANEVILKKQSLNEGMQASYALGRMQQEQLPLDFMVKVLKGNTDDPFLKDLSPGAKQKMLSQGQQLFSAQQQLEQRDERIRNEFITAQKTVHVDNIYNNPTSDTAQDSLKLLKSTATSPEERGKIEKLQEFVDNAEAERFQESDPEVVFDVEAALARGELTEDSLSTLHGEGLSNNDFNKYRAKVEQQRDSLIASPTFKLVKERMDAEFPSPKKLSQSELIMSMFSKKAIPGVSTDPEEIAKLEQNERLKNQMLLDLKGRILDDKSIGSEDQLLEAANAAIVKMRQEVLQGSTKGGPVVLTRPKQAAMQNTEAVEQSQKYVGKINKLRQDIKSGRIDADLGRAIYNIIKDEEADARSGN